jgi:hypothetical protein
VSSTNDWPGGLHHLLEAAKTERNLRSLYFEHYYNEKARIIQSPGGFFLMFPPGDTHVWQTEGLPIMGPTTQALKRISPPTPFSLALPVKWWVDRLPVDAIIIIADILDLSIWIFYDKYQSKKYFESMLD